MEMWLMHRDRSEMKDHAQHLCRAKAGEQSQTWRPAERFQVLSFECRDLRFRLQFALADRTRRCERQDPR